MRVQRVATAAPARKKFVAANRSTELTRAPALEVFYDRFGYDEKAKKVSHDVRRAVLDVEA